MGQNRTRGVGSLAKIGHPIIFVLLAFYFSHKTFSKFFFFSEAKIPQSAMCAFFHPYNFETTCADKNFLPKIGEKVANFGNNLL